ARQRLAGDGLHHRGEHLARCPLLRHHAPRRAPDDLARPPRGRRHRRRERSAALRLRYVAYPQARRDHRDHVLRDLHLLGLPARLRADERRARERDEHLRHLRLQPGHARRSARAGRRRGALDAAGARPPDRRADALPEARLMVGGRGLGLRTRRLYLPLGFFLVATLFPFYWMFVTSIKPLGPGNPLTPVMLTYPTLLIPFCAWLLMGYFKSVPRELEEAARIDGASRFQAMTRVVLPLCTPGLLSAGIFAFTLAQNEFLYALIFLTTSEVRTVPV